MDRKTPLGHLLDQREISQAEYNAGYRWGQTYHKYLICIGAPPHDAKSYELPSDKECRECTNDFEKYSKILIDEGKRVFHAVNAVAVYEDTEYGDPEFRIGAAKIGLQALVKHRIPLRAAD